MTNREQAENTLRQAFAANGQDFDVLSVADRQAFIDQLAELQAARGNAFATQASLIKWLPTRLWMQLVIWFSSFR